MEWTAQDIAEIEQFELAPQRGGYDPEAVDLLAEHSIACMRAGRPLPDPNSFALPRKRMLGTGYAAADVSRLVQLLQSRREQEWAAVLREPDPEPEQVAPQRSTRPAPSAYRWSQAQADWVRDKRFASRRGGYDQTDVDDFLDEVIIAMAHGQRLPDVTGAKFGQSGFKQGYAFEEVDAFLDDLAALKPENR